MPVVNTADLTPTTTLHPHDSLQLYCGLDSCISLEARLAEQPLLDRRPHAAAIYNFERGLQGPYLEMMLRGFAIDQLERHRAIQTLRGQLDQLRTHLSQLGDALRPGLLNASAARSHAQLKELFYEVLQFPKIWTSKKGVRKLSLERNALEKLYDTYLYARPFISHILTIRDLSKQLEVFESEIDPDGRFRTSYNIAGTETGRPSSSTNAFGTGGNAQNIAPGLRHVFIADPGYKLFVIDLEQAEARDVGFFEGCLFDDWSFLDSCESGDLHTNNAKLIWPELPWTGDGRRDREQANQLFYRDFTYRDMAKRGSHLSNYMGTAWTAARHLKVPIRVMEEFQSRYCRGPSCAFPAHQRYWQWVAQQLQTTYRLVTPWGRERHFFGRPDDDTTLREAIAFLPQSTTSDRMNLGLWKSWKYCKDDIQLLGQGYDSLIAQARENEIDDVIPAVLELISIPLYAPNGRKFTVPGEAKVGWNWGAATDRNPDGLRKWVPGENRTRTNNPW